MIHTTSDSSERGLRVGGKSPLLLIGLGILVLAVQLGMYLWFSPSRVVLAAQPAKGEKAAGKKEGEPDPRKKEDAELETHTRTNLQDVSSVFTYHLTALGLMFVFATVLLAIQQANAQKQDAKRNEERGKEQARRDEEQRLKAEEWQRDQRTRDEEQKRKAEEWQRQQKERDDAQDKAAQDRRDDEAKREKSIRAAMRHTATLIQHMSGVMGATEKTLKSTNEVRGWMNRLRKEARLARDLLRTTSSEFIQKFSLNDPSIAEGVRAARDQVNQYVSKVPSQQIAVEYQILDALNTGVVLGNSNDAFDQLERAVNSAKVIDQDLRARTHYFRGHFALRTGKFAVAQDHFTSGLQLKPLNDSYQLFVLYAELMELRRSKAVSEDERIRELFARYWNKKIDAQENPNVRSAVLAYFWEHLGHAYGALLAEGLCPEADPILGDPAEARKRLEAGYDVLERTNARSPSPAFDAVKFEIGIRLARLGDGSKLMGVDHLKSVIQRCRTAATSKDDRARIVYRTRLARFWGRLAAAYRDGSDEQRAAQGQMEDCKAEAIQNLRSFQQVADKEECVYSVFSNLFEPPGRIIQDIEQDVTLEHYREERRLAVSGTPPATGG